MARQKNFNLSNEDSDSIEKKVGASIEGAEEKPFKRPQGRPRKPVDANVSLTIAFKEANYVYVKSLASYLGKSFTTMINDMIENHMAENPDFAQLVTAGKDMLIKKGYKPEYPTRDSKTDD